jgi:hypothetical protein
MKMARENDSVPAVAEAAARNAARKWAMLVGAETRYANARQVAGEGEVGGRARGEGRETGLEEAGFMKIEDRLAIFMKATAGHFLR